MKFRISFEEGDDGTNEPADEFEDDYPAAMSRFTRIIDDPNPKTTAIYLWAAKGDDGPTIALGDWQIVAWWSSWAAEAVALEAT